MKKSMKFLVLTALVALSSIANAQSLSKDYYFTECKHKEKCTDFNLYMSAKQANEAKQAMGKKIIFLDVRTLEEVSFVGAPKNVDGYAQYMKLDELNALDKKKKAIITEPNSYFGTMVNKYVEKNGYTKDTPIVLLCRSGVRSAAAANLLKKAGYGEVYSIYDGFEGDLDKQGKRSIDGWKNAGLDFTFDISPELNLAD